MVVPSAKSSVSLLVLGSSACGFCAPLPKKCQGVVGVSWATVSLLRTPARRSGCGGCGRLSIRGQAWVRYGPSSCGLGSPRCGGQKWAKMWGGWRRGKLGVLGINRAPHPSVIIKTRCRGRGRKDGVEDRPPQRRRGGSRRGRQGRGKVGTMGLQKTVARGSLMWYGRVSGWSGKSGHCV